MKHDRVAPGRTDQLTFGILTAQWDTDAAFKLTGLLNSQDFGTSSGQLRIESYTTARGTERELQWQVLALLRHH